MAKEFEDKFDNFLHTAFGMYNPFLGTYEQLTIVITDDDTRRARSLTDEQKKLNKEKSDAERHEQCKKEKASDDDNADDTDSDNADDINRDDAADDNKDDKAEGKRKDNKTAEKNLPLPISNYELTRANNIKKNKELLEQLGLDDVSKKISDGKEKVKRERKKSADTAAKDTEQVNKPVLRSSR